MLPRDVELDSSKSATEFYPSLHAKFLYQYLPNCAPSYEQLMSEYLKMSGIYWTTTALQLIGRDFDQDVKRQIIDQIASCVHPSGGISPSVGHDPHLPHTLSAIQILVSYGVLNLDSSSSPSDESVNENENVIDVERTVQWIVSLQKEDGSFTGDRWGEVDTRFSFCAIAACALLNRLDAINLDAAVEFVLKCYNDIDGAFACRPNSESQASAIYCCLGTLSIAGQLDRIDADQLGWWLSERQLASGGLNGRPEKLPDLCYSWWVLSSLAIIGRLHWISKRKLLQYILACQDGQSGGFSDRPGNMVDPFHTVFGIAGLSLLCHEYLDDLVEEEGMAEEEKQTEYSEKINRIDVNAISETVRKVNPIFCMLESVIQRRAIRTQRLSVL